MELRIKAVPGASRDRIAGVLGDELKIQISAAPEKGKANQAIKALVAKALAVSAKTVTIVKGHTNQHKVMHIVGISVEAVRQAFDK